MNIFLLMKPQLASYKMIEFVRKQIIHNNQVKVQS